jgi:hypothetical protein
MLRRDLISRTLLLVVLFIVCAACLERSVAQDASAEATQSLSYAELKWNPPETGAEVWERAKKSAFMVFSAGRATGEVTVPTRKGAIYILKQGERLPNDDDCAIGRAKVEPVNGGAGGLGLVKFSGIEGKGLCTLGFGVVLPVGSQLEVDDTKWLGKSIKKGLVVVTNEGLEFRPQK